MIDMANESTIGITNELKEKLAKLKVHPREPFNDVIEKLLNSYKEKQEKQAKL